MTTLRDKAYQLARSYPGGAAALALRMGKNATSLNHELLGTGTAKLGLEDAAAMTALSGDLRILHAWNAEHGLLVVRMPELDGDDVGGCLERLGGAAKEFSALVAEVASDMGDGRISDNELARIEGKGHEVLASIHSLLAAARQLNAEGKP